MRKRMIKRSFNSLYTRLLIYFIIVMLVPLVLLSTYYVINGSKTLLDTLQARAEQAIVNDGLTVIDIIESYRHKTYQISTNPILRQIVQEDEINGTVSFSSVYEELFSIMTGDVYSASALIVSISGKVRYSTHAFPAIYDLRYQQNDWNPFFELSRASSDTASRISLDNRYITERNSTVVASILRRMRSDDGTIIGYAAVDLFMEAFQKINSEFVFSDLVLIDTDTFIVSSLLTDRFGTFARFPELTCLQAPYDKLSYQQDGAIVATYRIPNTSLLLAGIIETSPYSQSIGDFFFLIIVIGVLGIILAIVLAYFLSRSIAKPVHILARTMRAVNNTNLDTKIPESKITEIAQLDRSFNRMLRHISDLLQLTREEEAKIREAERKALESQMHPHFLYNTLNTIKSIAKLHGEEEILSITTRLAKLLRSSIDSSKTEWTIRDSFDLIDNYLTIQKIRFGDKLQVELDADPMALDYITPKLIIQPLVENAIIHGLEPKVGAWNITISAKLHKNRITVIIADNGVGFSDPDLIKDLDKLAASTHVGLYNSYRRLMLRYGDAAEFLIDSVPGEGTSITLIFPAEKKTGKK